MTVQDHLEEARFHRNLEEPRFANSKQPSAPERSYQQRMDALEVANVVRKYRAQLKRDIKAGRVDVIRLLTDPPEAIETMKVWDLLISVPKMGRVKVNKLLQTCRISPSKTMGGMSERQRAEMVGMMRRRP